MFSVSVRDRQYRTSGRLKASAVVGFILTIAFFLVSSPATATVMKFVDLIGLIEDSDVIVHGRVSDRQTYFDKEQGFVVTDTTLEVETAFHGDVKRTVTFQQWGGEYEQRTYHIPGDPSFETGEEVILFLTHGEAKSVRLYLTALSQSKYKIIRKDSDQILVMRDMSDVAILFDEPEGTRIGHVKESPTTLKSFLAELETLVAGIKGGSQ